MNCQNCKAKLSCGCQQRVASNKASVCSNCLSSYENMLKVKPVIKSTNAPTNLGVSYSPPKK
jgi:hypothetical protein